VIRSILILLLAVTGAASSVSQPIRVMPRVDMEHPTVREIVDVWIRQLDEWCLPHQQAGTIAASDGSAIAQRVMQEWFASTEELYRKFPPTILSVEPERDAWVVRTMFSTEDTTTRQVVVLGIVRTTLRRSFSGWSIDDPLRSVTAEWRRERAGVITFILPDDGEFDEDRADRSALFVRDVSRMFGVAPPEQVTYYKAVNRDELCRVLGVEYYAAPPYGITFPEIGVVVTGIDDEWYPHELAHIALRSFDRALPLFREGAATWVGGSLGKPFDALLDEYAREHQHGRYPSIERIAEDVVDQDDRYIIGAVLCSNAYHEGGIAAVRTLLNLRTPEQVLQHLQPHIRTEAGQDVTIAALVNQALEREIHGVNTKER
jgi:hypothetical protein